MKNKKQKAIDDLNKIIDKKILKEEDYTLQSKLHRQLTSKSNKVINTRKIFGTSFVIKSI